MAAAIRKARDPDGLTVAARVGTSSLAYLAGDQEGTDSVAIDSATLAITRRYHDPFGNPRRTTTQVSPRTSRLGVHECQRSVPRSGFVDEPSMLDGVDDIPWSELRCAGGTADDVPTLLRIVTSAPEEADTAVEELFGKLYCQGSVYEATPYAVPFLARIAAAGIGTATMLELLGRIGDGDEWELAVPGSARAALAAQIGVLAPLLGDPDDAVRATAAWALAQSREPDRLVPLLRESWDTEPHPGVRAAILKALSVLDPETAAGIAALLQQVYQFRTAKAAASYWRGLRAIFIRCPGLGAATSPDQPKVTQRVFAVRYGRGQAFQADVALSGLTGGTVNTATLAVVAGDDVFTIDIVGFNRPVPADPSTRTVMSELIARVS